MSKDEPVLVDDANSATTTRTAQTLPRVLLSLKQSKDRWSHVVPNRISIRLLKIHLLLLMVLTIVAVLGTILYTHRESYIYFWDFSDYQDKTINLAIKYSKYSLDRVDQWVQIIREFRGSTEQDYSYIPTTFTIPFVLLFGPSREEYIVSLTIFYLIPFVILMGAVVTKLVHRSSIMVFWSAAFIALAVPAVWMPSLRGYPDVGAAALIAVAMLTYMHDPSLKFRWQVVVVGASIALAILFRRHFVYDAIALFLAIALHATGTLINGIRQNDPTAIRRFARASLSIAATAVVALITLSFLGWPFIRRILHTDFTALYQSYQVPPVDVVSEYRAYYGLVAIGLACIGFVTGVLNRTLSRSATSFVLLFGISSATLWIIFVRQLGVQYTLHFTPWIICGLSAFTWTAWLRLRGWQRGLALTVVATYLAFNVLSSLAPADTLGGVARQLPSELPRISGNLFAAQLPPLERHDIPEITRLVQELRAIASPEDPILVAASSGILNDDILRHADSSLGQPSRDPWWIAAGNPRLNIVRPSQVDSRDFISLLPLLQAKYVVVASPFQHHLAVEEQDVVKVVHDAFLDEWEIARDFDRLPMLFALDKGVDVFIFERKRPTSLKVAVMTLARMRSRVVPTQDWVVLDATSDSSIQEKENGSYTIAVNPTDLDARLVRRFLFVNSRVDAGVVSGVIEHRAGGDKPLSVVVEAVNDQGEVNGSNTPVLVPIGRSEFSLSFASQTADYLLLTISGGPGVRNVVVTDLEVDGEAQGTMIRSHVDSSS